MPRPDTIVPKQTEIFRVEVLEKVRGVTAREGQVAAVQFEMRTPEGDPLDLVQFGVQDLESSDTSLPSDVDADVQLWLREYLSGGRTTTTAPGRIVDASRGIVEAALPAEIRDFAGVYAAEFAILNPDGGLMYSNEFYLTVDPSLHRERRGRRMGPPTTAEIRLWMRDSSPAEHRLLDTRMFDDADVAAAIAMCVSVWNDSLPPLQRKYTTQNFPYRSLWMDGIKAKLFGLAAEFYFNNDLDYQAAGITVADLRKGPIYQQRGDALWAEFKTQVKQLKTAENLNGWSGSFAIPYPY